MTREGVALEEGSFIDEKVEREVSSKNWLKSFQISKMRPGAPFGFTLRYCRDARFVMSLPTRLSESPA